MNILGAILLAALSAAEITNVKFLSPHLTVSRAKDSSTAYIKGPIRVDMSFRQAMVRRPILRVTCLSDVGGELVCHQCLLDKLRTDAKLRGHDAQAASTNTTMAAKVKYASAEYGGRDMNRGLFRFNRPAMLPKVLLFRFELWQNGELVETFESSHRELTKYNLPDDWYEWKKHPDLFTYPEN